MSDPYSYTEVTKNVWTLANKEDPYTFLEQSEIGEIRFDTLHNCAVLKFDNLCDLSDYAISHNLLDDNGMFKHNLRTKLVLIKYIF